MDYNNRWQIIGESLGKGGQGEVFPVIDKKKFHPDDDLKKDIKRSIQHISLSKNSDDLKENTGIFRNSVICIVQRENTSNWGALKILHKPEDARDSERAEERIKNEIQVMKEISHPNLIKILGDDPDSKWFVSKYYPKGTLFDNKEKFVGDFVKSLGTFRQIVDGVSKCHDKGYVHRDIKPQNVFMDSNDNLVLGDFGLVYYKDENYDRKSDSLESVGSRDWMPPWAMGKSLDEVNPTFDVFSLGKLLWSMVSGRTIPHIYFEHLDYQDFNLKYLFPDAKFIHLANPLFRKCMVESESKCFTDANDLLKKVDEFLNMINNNADWSDPQEPKLKCKICNIGDYLKRVDTDIPTNEFDFPRGDVKELGLNSSDHLMKIYTCNHCGNIQLFARNPGKRTPEAWIGKNLIVTTEYAIENLNSISQENSSNVEDKLSDEAKELLIEASKDDSGSVLKTRDTQGMTIQTNNKTFGEIGNRRSEARWEAALDQLFEEELLVERGNKGEVFEVTDAGYHVADSLSGK